MIHLQLRALVNAYDDIQRNRIREANRLRRKKTGEKQKDGVEGTVILVNVKAQELQEAYLHSLEEHEKKFAALIKKEVEQTPLWNEFLKGIKGVGYQMAAVILSEYDIEIATTVSKLCAFTGIVPGKDKKIKGQKCCFNSRLRSKMMGVLASSFMRSKSPYKKFYDDYKHRLECKNWGKNKLHRDLAARRYMLKMFFQHLYVAWRTLEGLPVRPPYAEEYLRKVHEEPVKVSPPVKKVGRSRKIKED